MTKPTPFFVLAIVTIALTVFTVWVIATIYTTSRDRDIARVLRSQNHYQPPKITCSYKGQPLWDCIRHVK